MIHSFILIIFNARAPWRTLVRSCLASKSRIITSIKLQVARKQLITDNPPVQRWRTTWTRPSVAILTAMATDQQRLPATDPTTIFALPGVGRGGSGLQPVAMATQLWHFFFSCPLLSTLMNILQGFWNTRLCKLGGSNLLRISIYGVWINQFKGFNYGGKTSEPKEVR